MPPLWESGSESDEDDPEFSPMPKASSSSHQSKPRNGSINASPGGLPSRHLPQASQAAAEPAAGLKSLEDSQPSMASSSKADTAPSPAKNGLRKGFFHKSPSPLLAQIGMTAAALREAEPGTNLVRASDNPSDTSGLVMFSFLRHA